MNLIRIRLPKEHVDRLSVIAKRQGVSVGVLLYETITNLIAHDESPTETAEDMENENEKSKR